MSSELEWRRRWKPDLSARPWKTFIIEDSTFLIKSKFFDDSYRIVLTDNTSVWFEELDEDAIKKRSKKLNPSVEAPVGKLLDLVRENIESSKKGTNYSVAFRAVDDGSEEEKILLTINTKLAGLPFVWKFYGSPASKEQVSEHLTRPLLAMVGELQRRQVELMKLLKLKDKQIDDYKAQGSSCSRKHLETVPFDETGFDNDMLTSKAFEEEVRHLGATAFGDPGQQLYSQIMTKHAWINRDPTQEFHTKNKRKRNDLEGESLLADENGSAAPSGPSAASWTNRIPQSIASQATTSPAKRSPVKRPAASPVKSPAKSPAASRDSTPTKDAELLRREALERKLQEEEERKAEKQTAKKKKKLKI